MAVFIQILRVFQGTKRPAFQRSLTRLDASALASDQVIRTGNRFWDRLRLLGVIAWPLASGALGRSDPGWGLARRRQRANNRGGFAW